MEKENSAKTVAMEQPEKKRLLPEDKYVVVGQFRMKRVRILMESDGKSRELLPTANMTPKFLEKNHSYIINAVKITDMDGLWSLRLPQTLQIHDIIISLYESGEKDDDGILQTLLCNYGNTTTIMDGLFHNLVVNAGAIFITKNDPKKTDEEKKEEYIKIFRKSFESLSADIASREMSEEEMAAANAEFDKLLQGTAAMQNLNGEKGS